MTFEIDNQTKKDLDIFGTYKGGKSVFDLFNFCSYKGGKDKLYTFLAYPSNHIAEITERQEAIKFFQQYLPAGLTIDRDALDFSEYYFKHSGYPKSRPSKIGALERKFINSLSKGDEYYLIEKGVSSMIEVLKGLYAFSQGLAGELSERVPELIKRYNKQLDELFALPEFSGIPSLDKIKAYDTDSYDYIFRYSQNKKMQFIFSMIYEYDAYSAVAKAAEKHQFSYPEILPQASNCLEAEGLFHPFVKGGIPNDIHFDKNSNLLFITGPNMAGKSTFLKALGVAVYLAHTGFPVPAKNMKLSILSGLCTTINISDNISSGYSHFYAEVMRVKYVAERLKTNSNMLVIFDELFRGTNVKDAYDGTLAIVSAFAKIRNSFFVISTHIVEAAKELKKDSNIKFRYFEIKEHDGHPVYTYKLKEGTSEDRLGMYIIKREKIIEMINDIADINTQNNKNDETI